MTTNELNFLKLMSTLLDLGLEIGDIFKEKSNNDNIKVLKQILIVDSHYTTWAKMSVNGKSPIWTYWGNPIKIYDDWNVDGSDSVYFYEGEEIGRTAFLQDSIYYTGVRNGIFANEKNNNFVRYDSDLITYMNFLDDNDEYYYLAVGDFVDKDAKPYVLKK